jgi:hypothetical protein
VPESERILEAGSRWRHVRRGTCYTVSGIARFQCSGDLDDADVVIYREVGGRLWARPVAEFLDGRFEKVGEEAGEEAGEESGPAPTDGRADAMIEEMVRRRESGEAIDPSATAWVALQRGLAPSEAGWVVRHVFGWSMPDAVHLAEIVRACRAEAGYENEAPKPMKPEK